MATHELEDNFTFRITTNNLCMPTYCDRLYTAEKRDDGYYLIRWHGERKTGQCWLYSPDEVADYVRSGAWVITR